MAAPRPDPARRRLHEILFEADTGAGKAFDVARLLSIRRPMRYALSFYGVVDLLSILPTWLSLVFAGTHSLLVIRGLRLLRVFRVLELAQFVSEATFFFFCETKNDRTFLFPPILREELRALTPSRGEHLLVDFTQGFEPFLDVLRGFTRERFVVYGAGREGEHGWAAGSNRSSTRCCSSSSATASTVAPPTTWASARAARTARRES